MQFEVLQKSDRIRQVGPSTGLLEAAIELEVHQPAHQTGVRFVEFMVVEDL